MKSPADSEHAQIAPVPRFLARVLRIAGDGADHLGRGSRSADGKSACERSYGLSA
jgi:hypothetical protein